MTTYTSLSDSSGAYAATLPDEVVSGLGGNDTLKAAASGNTLYGGDATMSCRSRPSRPGRPSMAAAAATR
jgi:hypothetical protein